MSRIFKESQAQDAALERLNSSYRTSTQIKDGRPVHSVMLVDNVTGMPWHESIGATHADALANAIATAQPGSKPKTAAEMAADAIALADENAKLRALVETLKARESEPAPVQEESVATPAMSRRRAGT
jgi:hypothetical protein